MGIDKDTVKFLKDKKKESLQNRERCLAEYDRLIVDSTDEELLPVLCERFNIKRASTITRWLADRGKYLNPASKAINDVMVVKQIAGLMSRADSHDQLLTDYMEELDGIDEDWVDIEVTDRDGRVETKRISKYEALRRASKERVENSQEFFKAARSILPQTVLNQVIDNRKAIDQYDDEQLFAQVSEGISGKE